MSDQVRLKIAVVIPAFNEENSVGLVIDDIPKELVDDIIIVNNNSSDATAEIARLKGVTVLDQPVPGYGRACLKGIEYLNSSVVKPDVVVFLDADYSDYPEQMNQLVEPIKLSQADMVIGSRKLGQRERGSMTIPQIFGNWLAVTLIHLIYRTTYTDLGPFRAIRFEALNKLQMQDKTYGWTVEMQIKAIKQKMKIVEIPVDYRKRIGFSKISGTVKGTIMAGYKIIGTIFKYSLWN